VCLFEDGKLIKKLAGNGYENAVSEELVFTPACEVLGFAATPDAGTEANIGNIMAGLLQAQESEEVITPITENPNLLQETLQEAEARLDQEQELKEEETAPTVG